MDKVRIAPIIVSGDLEYDEIAKSIFKVLKKMNKTAIVVASSDFTHYGLNYGYFPFSSNVKENMYKLDEKAISHIKKLDAYRFLDYIEEIGATICGKYPIACAIELCKLAGAKKGKLLKYYTSGDVVGEYGSAVGYGSILFERN